MKLKSSDANFWLYDNDTEAKKDEAHALANDCMNQLVTRRD